MKPVILLCGPHVKGCVLLVSVWNNNNNNNNNNININNINNNKDMPCFAMNIV